MAKEVADDLLDRRPIGQRGGQSAVMFASHNVESVRKILEQFRKDGLIRNRGYGLDALEEMRGRVVFAQLYGKCQKPPHVLPRLKALNRR